jgi:PAS domain-containing protein
VCDRCHLGIILSTNSDLAPKASEPFLIVDRTLSVCAVSRHAERLLGVEEPDAVNRILTEFIVPADAERAAQDNLMSLVVSAAGGVMPIARAVIRPTGEFGVFLEARIGVCGPPPAALVVLSTIE